LVCKGGLASAIGALAGGFRAAVIGAGLFPGRALGWIALRAVDEGDAVCGGSTPLAGRESAPAASSPGSFGAGAAGAEAVGTECASGSGAIGAVAIGAAAIGSVAGRTASASLGGAKKAFPTRRRAVAARASATVAAPAKITVLASAPLPFFLREEVLLPEELLPRLDA
jgi:hypothetical protein